MATSVNKRKNDFKVADYTAPGQPGQAGGMQQIRRPDGTVVGMRPSSAQSSAPGPTFSAGGFRGAAGQEMIRSQSAKYDRERREAADVSKLQGRKQAGELARSSMIMANQSADRKSRERMAGIQSRLGQQNIAQSRAWQVEDRDKLAKGKLAELQAKGKSKGRPGAMSEKEMFEARQDLSMQYNAKESKKLRSRFKTEEDYITDQLSFLQPQVTGQPAPTVQPQQTPDPGVGTYRFGSGQTIDAVTGLAVGQGGQPQRDASFPESGRSMYSPPVLPSAPQPIQLPKFGGGREVAPDVAATRGGATRFQGIMNKMKQRRESPSPFGQTEQQRKNALRLGSIGEMRVPSYY